MSYAYMLAGKGSPICSRLRLGCREIRSSLKAQTQGGSQFHNSNLQLQTSALWRVHKLDWQHGAKAIDCCDHGVGTGGHQVHHRLHLQLSTRRGPKWP